MKKSKWVGVVVILCCVHFTGAHAAKADESIAPTPAPSTQELPKEAANEKIFSVGLQGGKTFSHLSAPSGITPKQQSSLFGGVVLELKLWRMLSLFSGANFASYKYLYGEYVGGVRLDYIEVPTLLRVGLLDGALKPFVLAGPIVGIRILAETRAAGNSQIGMQPWLDAKSSTNRINVGLAGGVGLSYCILDWLSAYVAGYYMKGLLDVDKASSTTTNVNGIQAFGGVAFAIF